MKTYEDGIKDSASAIEKLYKMNVECKMLKFGYETFEEIVEHLSLESIIKEMNKPKIGDIVKLLSSKKTVKIGVVTNINEEFGDYTVLIRNGQTITCCKEEFEKYNNESVINTIAHYEYVENMD